MTVTILESQIVFIFYFFKNKYSSWLLMEIFSPLHIISQNI